MLRKRISRWTSRPDDGQHVCAFPESFWTWYAESYSRYDSLKAEAKKFSEKSTSVGQVKALFGPELPQPSTNQVLALLRSPFTKGDITKTYQLIRFFQLLDTGYFITNDGHERTGAPITLVGAENWENVMCYLDALLFLMFAKLESFEPLLFLLNQHANPLVNQLLGLLRVHVNLMRLGNQITTDLTMRLCECLMKLGYTEAMSHRQQDSAPLFEFLTETLQMPLLTFKVEIQHLGKHDDDDTKYSKERILFVSIPGDDGEPVKPENSHIENKGEGGEAILLEECLEHYFNNSISVRRELERRATLDSVRAGEPTVPEDAVFESPSATPIINGGMFDRQADQLRPAYAPRASTSSLSATPNLVKIRTRSSTLSIWSISSIESKPREVMLPAWMLLRLLPFYTDDNDAVSSDTTARNLRDFVNRRPVLPICLKRYLFSSENKLASRSKKRIIIPPVIDLPLFVADDGNTSDGGYKLILESALCHRGTAITSGHFVSAVRKNTHVENESLEQSLAALWYLYDDIRKPRVETKTFKEIFDKEWPYMLFYRLVASNGTRNSSVALSNRTSGNASPVMVPKGSKSKFWAEETLTPIMSRTVSTTSNDMAITPPLALHLGSDSQSSVPIPDILPSSPKFIDIRKRYLWYVTDKDKNYYKESAALSKSGSRNMSISFTPQFRRNSQWSETSNISGLALENSTHLPSVDLELVKNQLEELELLQKAQNTKEDVPPAEAKHRHLHRIFSNENEPPSLSKKHHRKRRSDYKKEKCVIV